MDKLKERFSDVSWLLAIVIVLLLLVLVIKDNQYQDLVQRVIEIRQSETPTQVLGQTHGVNHRIVFKKPNRW